MKSNKFNTFEKIETAKGRERQKEQENIKLLN